MRITQQGKLQIIKNLYKHNHRTQESSPVERDEQNLKQIGSTQFVMPQVGKTHDRNGLAAANKPIRSLRNSKQKGSEQKNMKMPIFDINFLKNSLVNLEKQELLEHNSGRRKKKFPISNRLITEKNYRLTQGSQKQEVVTGKTQRSAGKSKVKFRLGNNHKSNQKTQQLRENSKKRLSAQKYKQLNKRIISFPKSERIKLEGQAEEENHRSVGKYEKKLTQFEKQQLALFQMFYIGPRRIYSQSDFTDSEGDPKVMIHDSIAYRYEIINQLGRGSFGRVFKAFDHKKKEFVALKLIKNQKKFQQQAKVEIAILQTALLEDPKFRCNVVKMKGSFLFRGHSCIAFEILHKNLYQFLKQHQFAGFSHDLIRRFAIQILQTLCFFRKHKIIHCDLKPENILLKQENKSGIRVIDVGSGCFEDKQIYTYIQSRFYRAPEIIFGIRYTPAIDMWSFGCIVVELFTGFPIFPGESQNEQVLLFLQLLGYPPKEMLQVAERTKKFFDDDFKCKIPQEKGNQKLISSLTLQQAVGSSDSSFIDLIRRCLDWNPSTRITPAEALMHEWILKGLPDQIRQQHIQQVQEQFYQY